MKCATVREVKTRLSEMLRLAGKGKDVLITNHGRPVAVLHGLSEDELEDWVLAHHPVMRKSIEDAWRHYRKHGGLSVEEVMRRLEKRKGKGRGALPA